MTDKKISNFEFATLNYFITRAFIIGITFNTLIVLLKQDSWIIPALSIIPATIIIIFIDYIMKYKPKLNLAEKIEILFNNKISKIILIFLIIFYLLVAILNSLNMCNFIQSQFLSKTPLLIISIIFMITTLYIVDKGISVISRTSNILFYIGFTLLILSFIGLIPAFEYDNFKPFFTSSITDYFIGLNSFYAYNILPMFLLTMIPKDCFKNPKIKKTLFISYIISAISIFFIVFQTIATFGYELANLYEYPEFFVLKHVVLVNLSSRVESILIIQLLFDIFIYNIFLIYFTSNCIKTLFEIKKLKFIYLIVCVLVVASTVFISKYNIYLDDLIINVIPITISIFVSLLIILIYIKIKMSKR